MLYTAYYNIQMLVHRPFINAPTKPSPLPFPSLAICTNAARSCIHLMELVSRRGFVYHPHILVMLIISDEIPAHLHRWPFFRLALYFSSTFGQENYQVVMEIRGRTFRRLLTVSMLCMPMKTGKIHWFIRLRNMLNMTVDSHQQAVCGMGSSNA